MRLLRAVRWCFRGSIVGVVGAVAALVFARFVPWEESTAFATASVIVSAIAAAASGLLAPVSPRQAARLVDDVASLDDRVVTAWELRGRDDALARLQRDDAVDKLVGTDASVLTLGLPRAEVALLVGLVIVALLALLIPNPMDEVLRQRRLDAARIRSAAAQVQKLADETKARPSSSAVDQAKIEQALRSLAAQLQQTRDPPSALAAVSSTAESLRSQIPPGGAQVAGTLTAEAQALQQNAATRPLGNAIGGKDPAALARATATLAAALAQLTPEERSSIARALQNAANAAGANQGATATATSSALRAAARALAAGDLGEARAQLQAGQEALSQQISEGETASAVQQAIAGLDRARETINGAPPSPTANQQAGADHSGQSAPSGSSNSGQTPGQNSGNGSPSAAGTGQTADSSSRSGNNGQASAGANGSGAGQGAGGQSGGTGGRAAAGGQRAAEPGKTTPGDQVFVPGQSGDGTSLQQSGPAGPAVGAQVPYQQVLGQYAASAREHLDHQSLPPRLRDLVRKYFVGLEEGASP